MIICIFVAADYGFDDYHGCSTCVSLVDYRGLDHESDLLYLSFRILYLPISRRHRTTIAMTPNLSPYH